MIVYIVFGDNGCELSEDSHFLLEMLEKQRWEELGDLIQVPLFDAALTAG